MYTRLLVPEAEAEALLRDLRKERHKGKKEGRERERELRKIQREEDKRKKRKREEEGGRETRGIWVEQETK